MNIRSILLAMCVVSLPTLAAAKDADSSASMPVSWATSNAARAYGRATVLLSATA